MIESSCDRIVAEAAFRLGTLVSEHSGRRANYLNALARTLADATGVEGVGVTYFANSIFQPAAAVGVVGPWSEHEQKAFLEQSKWAPEDRVLSSRLAQMPGPRFRRTEELLPLDEFHASRLFNEFQRPRSIGDQATMVLASSDGSHLLVAIGRVDSLRPLSAETMRIAQQLAPLVERCWVGAQRRLPEWARTVSPRRRRVLELVAQGLDDHQIAMEMDVRYHTVRAHLKDLFRVAGVRSRLHLIQALRGDVAPAAAKATHEPTIS